MANTYLVVHCDPDQHTYYSFSTPKKAFTFLLEKAEGSLEMSDGEPLKSWSGEESIQVIDVYDPGDEEEDESITTTWELVVLKVNSGEGDCTSSK